MKKKKKLKAFELPPPAFSNAINVFDPKFNYENWQESIEWAVYSAGYVEGVRDMRTATLSSQILKKS